MHPSGVLCETRINRAYATVLEFCDTMLQTKPVCVSGGDAAGEGHLDAIGAYPLEKRVVLIVKERGLFKLLEAHS